MNAKSIRPGVKREVQKERNAKRVIRMCPRSGQIFENFFVKVNLMSFMFEKMISGM